MAGEIVKRINELEKALNPNNLAREAYKYFKSETPIRSGNARSRTRLQGNEIQADYPYAQRLDAGYSSQSPDGMTKPTERFIQEYINKQPK
ncbi:hypothetical protein UFOVP281_29 [uncultured Caudovirales phage]|uniref:Uncharacterized protein n=1 Tax=uncultured Caudovirales phage TaxID=2100421 RepID=A0A6J5LN02_9CAUD|nr:hypothetical protein UFOVP281_29 [uncultured Caudovirales phage]